MSTKLHIEMSAEESAWLQRLASETNGWSQRELEIAHAAFIEGWYRRTGENPNAIAPNNGDTFALEIVDSGQVSVPKNRRKIDDTPYDGIFNLWAEICPHLPQPRMPTDTRKSAMHAFWIRAQREAKRRGMAPDEWVKGVFELVRDSDALSGRKRGLDWKANLWWVMSPNKLAAIIDGEHDNHTARKI